jgi:hypothetical protein
MVPSMIRGNVMNRVWALLRVLLFAGCAGVALAATPAGAVDFGDDSSRWANDDECDDPRFTGMGMTATPLLDEDAFHDATDCRTEYEAGLITLRGPNDPRLGVEFGDNSSEFANDGECDDPRFEGSGMAATSLRDADTMHDAADCEQAFAAGEIAWRDPNAAPAEPTVGAGDFGDDSSQWANDGECDDPRFEGAGMAAQLLDEDIGRDATDCRSALDAGRVTWKASGTEAAVDIDFGDDASQWSKDGECDDPRFAGAGMTNTPLLQEDIGHDATDCRTAFEAGNLSLR